MKRKSTRTFDGTPVKEEDSQKFEQFLNELDNPFGVPVEFRMLQAKEHKLSSPVVVGTDVYFAAKVKPQGQYEIAYGYEFAHACLYAESLGMGTVMLAASISRQTFEKAMEVSDDEVMPLASPLGYAAQKRTIKDSLMRKGLKADARKPFEKLFYLESFEHELSPQKAGVFADALEMVRWAPSAVNKQPWRAVVDNSAVHFYENQTIKSAPGWDVQRIDIGIALAHFDLTMQEGGLAGKFEQADPKLETKEKFDYVISYKL
ncbi:MAG: nitroreductase [Eubacterium sp.]|nr:nitroreductase [Eubacterium sp.]